MTIQGKPTVSIITVVLNGVRCLEDTIISVLSQQYENIEYIVIDGGSIDGTLDILRKYEDKIDYFVSEPDKGIYDAMNKGIAAATGNLVGIVNSDDWLAEGVVGHVVEQFLETPDNVIYGLLREYKDEQVWRVHTTSAHFLPQRMIPHQTCFVPASLYNKFGSFDISYKYAADCEFLLRLFQAGVEFAQLDVIISNARVGGASYVNSIDAKLETIKIKYKYGYLSKQQFWKSALKLYSRKILTRK